jgi:hypothetical protein
MQTSRISRKGIVALVCVVLLGGPGMLPARDFFLEEGTEMAMRLRTSVDTKFNQKGDRIICTVEEPIVVDNVEVIPWHAFTGASATSRSPAASARVARWC